MNRIKTAVMFGGQSSEHEVSCMSAANIIEQIDQERYEDVYKRQGIAGICPQSFPKLGGYLELPLLFWLPRY